MYDAENFEFNFSRVRRHLKSLAVQRLKNNELEEQCIHHFNLIKYLVLDQDLIVYSIQGKSSRN